MGAFVSVSPYLNSMSMIQTLSAVRDVSFTSKICVATGAQLAINDAASLSNGGILTAGPYASTSNLIYIFQSALINRNHRGRIRLSIRDSGAPGENINLDFFLTGASEIVQVRIFVEEPSTSFLVINTTQNSLSAFLRVMPGELQNIPDEIPNNIQSNPLLLT